MRRQVAVLVLLLVLLGGVVAHAHDEKTPVLVDTDMALDDVRALALMLNAPHVALKALVISDGASRPDAGCANVPRVFCFLGREAVPVGVGKPLAAGAPPWREMSETLGWSDLPACPSSTGNVGSAGAPGATISGAAPSRPWSPCRDAVTTILDTVAQNEQGIVYVALGPLTNLAAALEKEPGLKAGIKDVYYYGSAPDDPSPDWNTGRDPAAVRAVFASGLRIHLVRPAAADLLVFDAVMLADVTKIDSPVSRLFQRVHGGDRMKDMVNAGHLKAWDETVALLLDNPLLGRFEEIPGRPGLFRLAGWDRDGARAAYLELVAGRRTGAIEAREPVVLGEYPLRPAQFQEDLRPWVPRIIALHGVEEWKATVLTNELHRHLGIYSILGAKMGILAREMLDASLDELVVESHAGLKPPLSCLNDGLQVATGASLGRGTISVPESGAPSVEAVFGKGGKKLRIRLKDSVRERIGADIRGAIQRHGDVTPEYFREVRRLSFEYWANMSRGEIFETGYETP